MNPKLLNIIKRRKQYISLCIDDDARSKSQTKDKTKIQLKIIDQMKFYQKRTIRKDIAVQIVTYTIDKKAPGIAKWAKNIIDIMHKQEYIDCDDNIKWLPFSDDKQIRYLLIKYIYVGEKTSTHIDILPFSAFISDLHLADELEPVTDKYLYDKENRYEDLIINKEQCLKYLSEDAYQAMLKMALEEKQREFGKLTSISEFFIRLCFPKRVRFYKQFERIHQDWAELLLDTPIKLKIPGLPTNGSEDNEIAKIYKAKIKELLVEYINKYDFLKNLQNSIIVSIIYRPEKNRIEKDIDNILLEYILPIVNEILNPPASLYRLTEYRVHLVDPVIKIPMAKDKQGSSIGYEILKVPQFDNKESGEIYIGFRFDSISDTLIKKTQDIIDKYIKENA